MKIINTHAHMGVEAPAADEMTLKNLFNASYVGWQSKLEDESEAALTAYFGRNSGVRAFHQLKRAVEALHGVGEPIRILHVAQVGAGEALTPKTWRAFDERLRAAYARDGYQADVLRRFCGYERILQDDYFDIGSGEIFGGEYDFSLRCDFMFYGYSKAALLSSEARPNAFFEDVPDNLADYAKKLRAFVLDTAKNRRCRALKVCMAYFRGLDFSPVSVGAEKVYADASMANIAAFQDFVMNELCNLAAELELPVQIHAGLGQGIRTNPNALLPLIKAHEATRFIIMHGGFPYTDELLNVLYICPNTILDMSWAPLLSRHKALETLVSAIELVGAERIVWGCDTNTVEESFGALMAANELADSVQARFASEGLSAGGIKEKIFYENAIRVFGM